MRKIITKYSHWLTYVFDNYSDMFRLFVFSMFREYNYTKKCTYQSVSSSVVNCKRYINQFYLLTHYIDTIMVSLYNVPLTIHCRLGYALTHTSLCNCAPFFFFFY